MQTLQRVACGLSLVALLAWAFPSQVQAVISFVPPITNRYDLGNTSKLFRSTVTHNLTVANFTSLNSTVNIYGAENVTGTLTSNAFVGNSTLNTTGLATLDNATVNGTLSAAVVNASGNSSVGGELAVTGNASVAGALYARPPAGATLSSTNLTLTSANVGIVWVDGMGGDRTLTLGTAASVGNGGWYEVRSLGNVSVNGNVTVNVTSAGNINGVDTYSIQTGPWQVTRLVSNGSTYSATSSAP